MTSTNSKVTIVCATYLKESDKYLRVAIESVKNLDYDNYELILVSSGEHVPQDIPKWIKHIHHRDRHHYPEAINSGIKEADPESKYYLLINDDVIMTRNSLTNLVNKAMDNDIILNPISNCDNFFKYNLIMGFSEKNHFMQMNQRFYRFNDLDGKFEKLMNSESIYPWGIISQEFICFYATLIPKKVWDRVGGLDPQFKTGQDDVDFSLRCKEKNIACAVALDSLIWHYGGATADLALTPEIRRTNIEYFAKKWGRLPPT